MSSDDRYRQLALFSVIVGEVVFLPMVLGGGVYLLLKTHPARVGFAAGGAVLGLLLAFYRIMRLLKKHESEGTDGK